MLSQLVSSLNLNLPFDTAVTACACTAFEGQCCLGKLLPVSSSTSFPTSFPLHSGFRRSIQNPQSCILYLLHMKTHPHGKEVVLVDHNNTINPISLLRIYIHINSIPKDGLLLSFRESGTLTSLDKTSLSGDIPRDSLLVCTFRSVIYSLSPPIPHHLVYSFGQPSEFLPFY